MEPLRKDVKQILSDVDKMQKGMDNGRTTLTNELQNKILKGITLNSLFMGYLCVFFTVKLFIEGK